VDDVARIKAGDYDLSASSREPCSSRAVLPSPTSTSAIAFQSFRLLDPPRSYTSDHPIIHWWLFVLFCTFESAFHDTIRRVCVRPSHSIARRTSTYKLHFVRSKEYYTFLNCSISGALSYPNLNAKQGWYRRLKLKVVLPSQIKHIHGGS